MLLLVRADPHVCAGPVRKHGNTSGRVLAQQNNKKALPLAKLLGRPIYNWVCSGYKPACEAQMRIWLGGLRKSRATPVPGGCGQVVLE